MEGVVSSIEDLCLEGCDRPEHLCRRAGRPDVGLVLLHAAAGGQDVAALLGRLKTVSKRVPVMILSDRDDPEQELSLFRLGVTDFFARPLDLHRLSLAVDSHTIDARVAL